MREHLASIIISKTCSNVFFICFWTVLERFRLIFRLVVHYEIPYWAPRCTAAAVGPKNTPRWGGFRGGRWMCGGIHKNIIHLRSTSRGVSFRNFVFAVEFSRKYGRFSLFFSGFAYWISTFQLLSLSLPKFRLEHQQKSFPIEKSDRNLKITNQKSTASIF